MTVMEQVRQGASQREIARNSGLSRQTVRRWISAHSFPERRPSSHSTTSISIKNTWSNAGNKAVAMPLNSGASCVNKGSMANPASYANGPENTSDRKNTQPDNHSRPPSPHGHPRAKSHGCCSSNRKRPGRTSKNCTGDPRRSLHAHLWRESSAASSGSGTPPRGCAGAMPLSQARWQTLPSISPATKKLFSLHFNIPGATVQSKAMFTD